MVDCPEVAGKLGNQSHFFNREYRDKRLTPAGPDHAQIAAARCIADYFAALFKHHRDGSLNLSKRAFIRQLFRDAESAGLERLMSYLRVNSKVRIIGPTEVQNRAPTISVTPKNKHPQQLVQDLSRHGIMCGSGHFYSYRLIEAMGIDPDSWVTRFSFVHYTSDKEIEQLIEAPEQEL